jgi:hypothetical protein
MPAETGAEFPAIVLPSMTSVPVLEIPPPRNVDTLPETVQLLIVRKPALWIAPPPSKPRSIPFVMVRPEMLAFPLSEGISKMRKSAAPAAVLRVTVKEVGPGPVMLTSVLIDKVPFVSAIVLLGGSEKVITSLDWAVRTASRNVHLLGVQVPFPSSAVLFTVKVAASADVAMSKAEMNPASEVRYRPRDFFISKQTSLGKKNLFMGRIETLREESKEPLVGDAERT